MFNMNINNKYTLNVFNNLSGTAETAGLGSSPPAFRGKIYKLIELKAKVVIILKISTSDLHRRCMRHAVRGIHHINPLNYKLER